MKNKTKENEKRKTKTKLIILIKQHKQRKKNPKFFLAKNRTQVKNIAHKTILTGNMYIRHTQRDINKI